MSDAHERTWVRWPHVSGAGLAFSCQARPPAMRTEYIRADLHTAEVEALRKENERLRAVFDAARAFDEALGVPGANVGSLRLAMHKAIRAALQGETK